MNEKAHTHQEGYLLTAVSINNKQRATCERNVRDPAMLERINARVPFAKRIRRPLSGLIPFFVLRPVQKSGKICHFCYATVYDKLLGAILNCFVGGWAFRRVEDFLDGHLCGIEFDLSRFENGAEFECSETSCLSASLDVKFIRTTRVGGTSRTDGQFHIEISDVFLYFTVCIAFSYI